MMQKLGKHKMSDIEDTFERLTDRQRRVLLTLAKHTVDFIIIGGFAEIYYGIKRQTRDLDILIPPRRENAEAVAAALQEMGEVGIKPADLRVRLSKPLQRGRYFDVDFLTLMKESEYSEFRDRSVIHVWDEVSVRIVAKTDLLKLKEGKSGAVPGQ